MARLFAIFALAISLTASVACFAKTEKSGHGVGESPRTKTTHREATDAPDRVTSGKGEATLSKATATWDYVALGDSLAAGVGARQGYVDRYAGHLRADAGARVRVTNLGVSGQTSAQLLRVLRNDASARRAISGAEVITFNIGINDLGRARGIRGRNLWRGAQPAVSARRSKDARRKLEHHYRRDTGDALYG